MGCLSGGDDKKWKTEDESSDTHCCMDWLGENEGRLSSLAASLEALKKEVEEIRAEVANSLKG
eukprot:1888217-Lingulodinium_polyedra.AAC.1